MNLRLCDRTIRGAT